MTNLSSIVPGAVTNIVDDTNPQLGGNLDANGNDILIDDGNSIKDESGNEQIKFATTATAVNEITVKNAATGNFPIIRATGEADTGLNFENSEAEEILILDAIATAVNELTIKNAATGSGPILEATGGDSNVDINLVPKGTGVVNLADVPLTRPQMKDYSETVAAVSSSSNVLTLDLENGNVFTCTLTENVSTLTISNWLASKAQSLTLFLIQDSSERAFTWTNIIWSGGTAPDLSTVSSKHVITIASPDGGTTKYGFINSSNAAAPA